MFISSLALVAAATTILHGTDPAIRKCPDITYEAPLKLNGVTYTEGAWMRGNDSLTIEYNGDDGTKMYVVDGRNEYDMPNGCSYTRDPATSLKMKFTADKCAPISAEIPNGRSTPDGDPSSILIGSQLFIYEGSGYADGFMENSYRSREGHWVSHTIPDASPARWTTDLDPNCSFALE